MPDMSSSLAPGDAPADIQLEQVTKTTSEKSGGSLRQRTFGHRIKPTASRSHEQARTRDGEIVTINAMGKLYRRIKDWSIITRYFFYVLPLGLCIAIPIVIGATAAQDAKIGGVRIVWFFTWIEIVWLSLWVSKVVAHFLPAVWQVLAGVVSSDTRRYALILQALQMPLSFVGWTVTSLATFMPIMTRNPTNRADHNTAAQNWETIVQSILGAAVAASLVLLFEKLIIQLISINYHRKQFNAKIRDSKHNVYLLGLLYDASRRLFPMYCTEFAEEDYVITDQLDLTNAFSSKRRSNRRSGNATPARLLLNVGKFGDQVTSAFGNVAQEITGKQVFNPNSAHAIVSQALERTKSSEALAKRLWMSFVIEGRDALYHDDIMDVLGQEHQEEGNECFAALDRDGNGDVSLEEMIVTVTEIGRDRKSIANSLHDVDQAINVLDRLLLGVCLVAIVFIFVAFLNKNFVTTLATAGTALISLSFVFSITAQEFLGSCIFLFIKHPYDISDMVVVLVGVAEQQLIVDHISLLFTVFRRASGPSTGRLVQIPNIVLNTLWIENISRSKAMKEQLTLMISYDTSFEDIQIFKSELKNFVMEKENSRDFSQDFEVEVLGTSDMSKLELRVEIRHKSNWSNESVRAARRSKFMCAMIAALRRVPIYGPGGGSDALGSKANASYSVAISDAEAKKTAEQAAKDRDATRLVPLETDDKGPDRTDSRGGAQNPSSQQNAITDLTSRPPAYDNGRDELWSSSRGDSDTLEEDGPMMDRQDVEEVRGILRKETTKGRRRAESGSAELGPSNSLHSSRPLAETRFPIATTQSEPVDRRYPLNTSGYQYQRTGYGNGTNREMPYSYPTVPVNENTPVGSPSNTRLLGSQGSNPATSPYRVGPGGSSQRPLGPSTNQNTNGPRKYEDV